MNSNFQDSEIQKWINLSKNSGVLFTLFYDDSIEAEETLFNFVEDTEKYNKLKILNIKNFEIIDYRESEEQINFPEIILEDEGFIQEQSYILTPGESGLNHVVHYRLQFNNKATGEFNFILNNEKAYSTQFRTQGLLLLKTVNNKLYGYFDQLKQSIMTNDKQLFSSLTFSNNEQEFETIMSLNDLEYILTNTTFITLELSDEHLLKNEKYIEVGYIKTYQNGCNNSENLNVIYDYQNKLYLFENVYNHFQSSCKTSNTDMSIRSDNVLTCTDCTLAPVNKGNSLRSDYIPNLVNTGVLGGGTMTPDATNALRKMFDDAVNNGVNLKILSTYRSYQTQVSVYNSWVNKEMNSGKSYKMAQVAANNYSALPGQSEHQLGTVADVVCSTCSALDYSQGNIQVYDYLKKNAYKFGFVISYPENKQYLTGYKYEPWHIRYIGVDLATEFFNSGYLDSNNLCLSSYLFQQGSY